MSQINQIKPAKIDEIFISLATLYSSLAIFKLFLKEIFSNR